MNSNDVTEYQNINADLFNWLNKHYADLFELGGEALQNKIMKQSDDMYSMVVKLEGYLVCEDFACKYYKAFDERGYSFVCTRAKEGQKKYYYTSKPPEFCRYCHDWSWIDCERYKPESREE